TQASDAADFAQSWQRLAEHFHTLFTTVLDREMIRASGFRDIPELLRLVPGFSVAYTGDNTWTAVFTWSTSV
ncbi:MAG: Plug domain-containing protein, partial [Youngiibacter sp.]|nr:Plug domain-containing protein [Youngiibacter sp.]